MVWPNEAAHTPCAVEEEHARHDATAMIGAVIPCSLFPNTPWLWTVAPPSWMLLLAPAAAGPLYSVLAKQCEGHLLPWGLLQLLGQLLASVTCSTHGQTLAIFERTFRAMRVISAVVKQHSVTWTAGPQRRRADSSTLSVMIAVRLEVDVMISSPHVLDWPSRGRFIWMS